MKIDKKYLYEIRQKLKYGKGEMCRSVGISLTALTNIERGLSNPKPENEKKICEFLTNHGYNDPMIITK